MRILLVDDEAELTDSLERALSRQGYQVDTAYEGITGAALAIQESYDLLILDWMLPQITGLEICGQLRTQGSTVPVLFLTAKDTIDDRVAGLDAGADDYLVKPFELRELLARVRALLRRSPNLGTGSTPTPSPAQSTRVDLPGLSLDLKNQVAHYRGQACYLSEKESQLLAYLMHNHGQVLTHEQISAFLWPDGGQPASNALAALIRLLRRKIERRDAPSLIHTVYGRGYRLDLPKG